MGAFLFQTIIYPIHLIIEVIYMVFMWVFKGNVAIAITGVSLTVSLLCLPLYAKAEKLQEAERTIQRRLAARVASIKAHFKGDEQYMILSTYYRQNHYHPIYALRSSISLLVQVPFFIAAFIFLSHLESIKGEPFLFITDLGREDGLLKIWNISINILPILMTAINIFSGWIYTRGFPQKEKIQLYAMALLFLFLLYHSPAALVIYWTLNNLFSLAKNIVFKLKDPLRFLYIALCVLLVGACLYVAFVRFNDPRKQFRNISLALTASILLAAIPLYIRFARWIGHRYFAGLLNAGNATKGLFIASAGALFVLLGFYIPFNLVASSPFEFSGIGPNGSPFELLFYPATQAAGFFLIWPIYIYLVFPNKTKAVLTLLMTSFVALAVVNSFILNISSGPVAPNMQFIEGAHFSVSTVKLALNMLISLGLVGFVCFVLSKGSYRILSTPLFVFILALSALVIFKGVQINAGYAEFKAISAVEGKVDGDNGKATSQDCNAPVFTLSKTEKNVFVIMLDRAINSYFPLVLDDLPSLKDSFSGFSYYPHTLSYGRMTIIGSPPLFGGYEYTPMAMNARSSMRMVEKHNEAVLMMPTAFKEHGYRTMVTDIPLVNYKWVANNTLFKERGIGAKNLIGNYSSCYLKKHGIKPTLFRPDMIIKRDLLLFGVMTALPAPLKKPVYEDGNYWSASPVSSNTATLDNYAVMDSLGDITTADSGAGTFSIMVNNITHEPALLEPPDYQFGVHSKGKKAYPVSKRYADIYSVNAAAMVSLAQWFDRLKALGVWDNTRIIIVSDHGGIAGRPGFDSFDENQVAPYNPLLLVKDFNATGSLATKSDIMTNGDVPTLATRELLPNLKNPFTGTLIDSSAKYSGVVIVRDLLLRQETSPNLLTTTSCYSSGAGAWKVQGDMFDPASWKEVTLEK